ncbi:MAG: branched-chain amino acid ABC transporter permease, partial [Desulfurococcaceae archaeon]
RLKGPFLGITLLAFGDIIVNISWNYQPLVGGTIGIWVADPLRFLGPARASTMVLVALAVAIIIYVYAELLAHSPYGRMLKAVRDAEIAAEVYGKNVIKTRAQVLIVGGAVSAIAGALWALYTGSMKAVTYTRLTWTFWPWAFLMLGGVGNNLGVLVGVFIYTVVRTAIILYKGALSAVIPMSPEWLEYILIGLALIAIMLFRPQGLIPEKPTPALPRKKLEEIKKRVYEEAS